PHPPHPAADPSPDHHPVDPRPRLGDPVDCVARLSRTWPAAADARMGRDDQRDAALLRGSTGTDARALRGDLHGRARLHAAWRRDRGSRFRNPIGRAMTELALSVEDLAVHDSSGTPLVSDVRFDLPKGTCLTLIGETGSGKSLVAQALMGLLPDNLRVAGTV